MVVAPTLPNCTSRTQASIVHDLIVAEIGREFHNVPGAECMEAAKRQVLLLGDNLLIRFKKLDERLMASNYPTQMATDFSNQLDLPGVPGQVRLTAGYLLNTAGTEILDCFITLQNASTVQWSIHLPEQVAELTPIGNVEPQGTAKRNTLRSKARKLEKIENNEDA